MNVFDSDADRSLVWCLRCGNFAYQIASVSGDKTIKVWDARTGHAWQLQTPSSTCHGMVSDTVDVAQASSKRIILCDMAAYLLSIENLADIRRIQPKRNAADSLVSQVSPPLGSLFTPITTATKCVLMISLSHHAPV